MWIHAAHNYFWPNGINSVKKCCFSSFDAHQVEKSQSQPSLKAPYGSPLTAYLSPSMSQGSCEDNVRDEEKLYIKI